MKRVFLVRMESVSATANDYRGPLRLAYETVADTAVQAIHKAKVQAKRDYRYRGAYIITKVKHRGPAV